MAKFNILSTPVAIQETENAIMYYEQIKHGLGIDFLDELERKYNSISSNPLQFGFIDSKNIL